MQLPSAALNREVLTVAPTNLHLPDSSEKPLFLIYSIPLAHWHIQMGHICLGQLANAVVKEHVHINTICNNITHSFRLSKHIYSILRNAFKQSPLKYNMRYTGVRPGQ